MSYRGQIQAHIRNKEKQFQSVEIFVVSEKNVKYAQHLAVPNRLFPAGIEPRLFPGELGRGQLCWGGAGR